MLTDGLHFPSAAVHCIWVVLRRLLIHVVYNGAELIVADAELAEVILAAVAGTFVCDGSSTIRAPHVF